MTKVIKLHNVRSGEDLGWLKSFDANTHAPGKPYPSGSVVATYDIDQAMTFASSADAMIFAMQTSTTCPTRPDGRPNKPLTAYTISIEDKP